MRTNMSIWINHIMRTNYCNTILIQMATFLLGLNYLYLARFKGISCICQPQIVEVVISCTHIKLNYFLILIKGRIKKSLFWGNCDGSPAFCCCRYYTNNF